MIKANSLSNKTKIKDTHPITYPDKPDFFLIDIVCDWYRGTKASMLLK